MRTNSKNSINDRLHSAQVAIDNTLEDPILVEGMSKYGYPPDSVMEGKSMYLEAKELVDSQRKEYGEQTEAMHFLHDLFDEADHRYAKLLKIARIVLEKERNSYLGLGLAGRRKRSMSGWLNQAQTFYNNALAQEDVLETLGRYGITKKDFQDGKKEVEVVQKANNKYLREIGDAQQATIERDEAIDSMEDWMGDFISIARIAFDEDPQYLEKMGVVIKS